MKNPFVVTVSAISGGGKTSVSKELGARLPNASVLYFDSYDFDAQPEHVGEWIERGASPDAWDLSPMQHDIEEIINSASFDYLVLDYPFGKKDYPIKKYIDFAVWIDTPPDMALARRIVRDYTASQGKEILGELRAYALYLRKYFVIPPEEIAAYYDISVDGTSSVDDICSRILQRLDEIRSE